MDARRLGIQASRSISLQFFFAVSSHALYETQIQELDVQNDGEVGV